MILTLDPKRIADYRAFREIKRLPVWRICGRQAWFPDEYASRLGIEVATHEDHSLELSQELFDYQRDIASLAIARRKFSVFADCGLGKTLIMLEFARHASGRILIVSPLMVIPQTIAEAERFYPGMEIEVVPARSLPSWLRSGPRIGITNYESIKPDLPQGDIRGLILDESSMLKSHYGKWGSKLVDMGRGLEWKLALTGTPAPNDRIEYANHAVFMDAFPTVNSFLATYFINRGQTHDRWAIKDHALPTFYRSLSHWCIFLTNPATYGWKDNCESIPPINVHVEHVSLTIEQSKAIRQETGKLFATDVGGIAERGRLSQIAKGTSRDGAIPTNKPAYIRERVDSWPDESTIIWCHYNAEQDELARWFPEAANIDGRTPAEERQKLINEFKTGRRRVLISKPKILGFGLNLQAATRQVFSGITDSYEAYYQAVKRSNRYGSTRPLNVHIPVTDVEEPLVANVLRKARMVQQDTETQERIFQEHGYFAWQ